MDRHTAMKRLFAPRSVAVFGGASAGKAIDQCRAVGYDGEIFQLDPIKLCPVPDHHIPLLVGGHAKPALRRAARLGDGWISAGSSLEELQAMIGQIEDFRKDFGRDQGAFEYHAMTEAAYSTQGLDSLTAAGVTEVIIAFRNPYDAQPDTQTVEEKIGMINWYADNVMRPFREAN